MKRPARKDTSKKKSKVRPYVKQQMNTTTQLIDCYP